MSKEIRVRMAPSPTGFLHVGTARLALFNWFFAQKNGGKFILRIEDTDRERSEKRFEEDILESMKWLGMDWDEFYRQTDRSKVYSKYLEKLLSEGKAFWCYHTIDELELEQKEQMAAKKPPRHVCSYRDKTNKESKPGIIRLKTGVDSNRKIIFHDLIRGDLEFEERLLGDISIAKGLETPLYNLAVVVDDAEMKISHVIRGEDHIANTPKQILIGEALGFNQPIFAHLPLLLGEDRSKLSKRHGAVAISSYKEAGYLPQALVNFLSLLGWTPPDGQEILDVNDIISKFELEKVHKSGAIFDIKKLNWLNSQYLKKMSDEDFLKQAGIFVEKYFGKQNENKLTTMLTILRERLEHFDQVKEFGFLFQEPDYQKELLVWKKSDIEGAIKALELVADALENKPGSNMKKTLDDISNNGFGGDRGAAYWPFRVALSGQKFSPDPIEISNIIGHQESLARLKKALAKLK